MQQRKLNMNLENDDETGEEQQSIEDVLRNNFFKTLKNNMLRHSISVDMKVYTLQLKQKCTAVFFHGIFAKCVQLLSGLNFGATSKRKQRRRSARSNSYGFRFSLIPGQLVMSHETVFFLRNFSHSRVFKFVLCHPFL